MKSVIDITNATAFEVTLKTKNIGVMGDENPKIAQTAKIKNIPAKEKKVYLVTFIKGESNSRDIVVSSIRNKGKKNSNLKSAGFGGIGGYVLPITIRSKGSSKTIGPAIAQIAALRNATFTPFFFVNQKTTIKLINAKRKVKIVIGFSATVPFKFC
jgi:hypothetical protein